MTLGQLTQKLTTYMYMYLEKKSSCHILVNLITSNLKAKVMARVYISIIIGFCS